MRKLYLIFILILMAIPSAFSKDEDGVKREKMFREVREFKMKYLAQEMDLTDEQKPRFFELYEEMCHKRDDCFKTAKELERKLKKGGKDASEEDYQKATEAMNQANAEAAEIEKNYNEKFSEFLSQKQIYKLKEAEHSFRSRLEEMKINRKKGPEKGKMHKR